MENRLRFLYGLQRVDSGLDELEDMKGDLPGIVANLEERIAGRKTQKKELEDSIRKSLTERESTDLEIITLREKIEKYKSQQFEVKTNRQYDALTREIDGAQVKINQLSRLMETLEAGVETARKDLESFGPELETMEKELEERRGELEQVSRENEDEELKLRHEREKLVARIEKNDIRVYERIRKAKRGRAVVLVRRDACGGCFKKVPPQTMQELRKNSRILTCEHCGRIVVSDEIARAADSPL